jgi:sugar/nucleoside kinase (ribokinase family)
VKILGFGDNIIDRFVDRGLIYPGGNCVNVAVFARQLGADAAYLGVFGSDGYARLMREALTAEGIALDRSIVREGPSGLSDLTVEDGERVFGGWNGGGVTVDRPIVLDEELVRYASGFDLVHSSVYSAAEDELPKLRSGDALVSYDFSSEDIFRGAEYLDRVCPFVDLALV